MDEEQQAMLLRVLGALAIAAGGEIHVSMLDLMNASGTCVLREDGNTMSLVVKYYADDGEAQAAADEITAHITATRSPVAAA